MSTSDQRSTQRKYADYVVEFYDSAGALLVGVGRLVDLSATGALVESSQRLTPGGILLLRLRRGEHPDLDLLITVVRVHRKAASITYGLKFIRA